MKEKDIGEKVELEYGEGWGWKRVVATIALATAIVGGATYGAMQSYEPQTRTERRTETREKQTPQPYEKKTDYVAIEQ
jgi:hypothetical protein